MKKMKKSRHQTILQFLYELRNSHPIQEHIFLYGGCMNLFVILHTLYPEAKPWYNVDHIITEISGKFYDITGRVANKGYAPFTDYYNNKKTSRAFKQMYNSYADITNFLKIPPIL